MAQACGGDSKNLIPRPEMPVLWIWGFVDLCVCGVSWMTWEDLEREWSASALVLSLCSSPCPRPLTLALHASVLPSRPAPKLLLLLLLLGLLHWGYGEEFHQDGFVGLVLPPGGKE